MKTIVKLSILMAIFAIAMFSCKKENENEKEEASLTVTSPPAKTDYAVCEPFDPAGMVVTVEYTDNTTAALTVTDAMLTYDFSKAGDGKTVTITYKGKEASVTGITVIATLDRLKAALGKTATVIIYGDEEFAPGSLAANNALPAGTNLTLKGVSPTLTKSDNTPRLILTAKGCFFTVSEGTTLTLSDITLDGSGVADNNSSLVMISGTLVMKDGVTVTGNSAGGVHLFANGVFNMEGGSISNNKDGGVYIAANATFNLKGGSISDNRGILGIGVYVGGSLTMSGGDISSNKTSQSTTYGGGVYVYTDAVFTMTGGTISGNDVGSGSGSLSGSGGGVWVQHKGTFTMTGGVISDNKAERGKDVAIYAHVDTNTTGIFRLSGAAKPGHVTLFAESPARAAINLPAAFSGSVASVSQYGIIAGSLSFVKNLWLNAQVVVSSTGTIDVAKFPLGNFQIPKDGLTENIDGAGYKLDNTGKLVVK